MLSFFKLQLDDIGLRDPRAKLHDLAAKFSRYFPQLLCHFTLVYVHPVVHDF